MKNYRGKMKNYTHGDFYVSPKGCDRWSGRLPEPNADGTDGPFATVERARDEVRAFKNGTYRNVYVLIRGGEYKLTKEVKFHGEDSHYDAYKVVYAAYPGETPVFHSDVDVTGWAVSENPAIPDCAKGKVFEAPYKMPRRADARMYTLYDDGKQLTRAKSKGFVPREGLTDIFNMEGAEPREQRKKLLFPQGCLRNWENMEDVEIAVEPIGFAMDYLALESVDESNCVAYTKDSCIYDMLPQDRHQFCIDGGLVRAENVIDFLTEPGMWVVNSLEQKIYYWPESGQPGHVTFPGLVTYFQIDGHEKGGEVRNLSFEGLTFTRGEREVVTDDDIGLQHDWNTWNKSNTLIRFRDASYCCVDSCCFLWSGAGAVRFDLQCRSNVVKNNLIAHVGGTGILVAGYGPGKLDVSGCNRIENNHIHHCGDFFYQSPGIMIFHSSHNTVRQNLLHHTPYIAIVLTGIRPHFFPNVSSREMTGLIRRQEIPADAQYREPVTSNEIMREQWKRIVPYFLTRDNLIEENEIFCAMQRLFDGNGIYLSDIGCGNIIRRNYIHHLCGHGTQQAIRTDANLKETTITENVIYNCTGGGINTKFYENHVENNIIADIRDIVFINSQDEVKRMFIGYVSLLEVYERDKMPPNAQLRVQRNIFYKTNPIQPFYRESMVNGKLQEIHLEEAEIDYNLYYGVNEPDHGQARLDYYQTRGADPHGAVGDPMFEDIANGNFTLKADSPALKLGFRNIDMAGIGLNVEYPAVYEKMVQEELGEDYADFHRLEKLCNQFEDANASYMVVDNV